MTVEGFLVLKDDFIRFMVRLLRKTKLIVAILGTAVASYVLVGTIFFGRWWLNFVWLGEFRQSDYWVTSLHEETILVVWNLVLVWIAVGIGYYFRSFLIPVIDRFWFWMSSTSLVVMVVTSLLNLEINRFWYELAVDGYDWSKITRHSLFLGPPKLKVPIDFHFLDERRVEILYNQIEPELVERTRTVSTKDETALKGGAGLGSVAVEGEISEQQSLTKFFERTDFSPARKGVDTINFVLTEGRAKYFPPDVADWYYELWQSNRQSMEEFRSVMRELQSEGGVSDERLIEFLSTPTLSYEDIMEEIRQVRRGGRQELSEALRRQVASLEGLVFLDGVFSVQKVLKDHALLKRNFSDEPLVIFFVEVPGDQLRLQPETSEIKLRVFGTVIKHLEKGQVEIRPLAVF